MERPFKCYFFVFYINMVLLSSFVFTECFFNSREPKVIQMMMQCCFLNGGVFLVSVNCESFLLLKNS